MFAKRFIAMAGNFVRQKRVEDSRATNNFRRRRQRRDLRKFSRKRQLTRQHSPS